MRRAVIAAAVLLWGCTTTLERGELLYRQGDRLGALETWRTVPEGDDDHEEARRRIEVVEEEFEQLVVRYKQRGRYFEARGRLGESILNYRLALKLQPDDSETLAHVQLLARTLAERKGASYGAWRDAFAAGDLRAARSELDELRSLDAFDPALETAERQLEDAMRAEVNRRLAVGRAGFSAGNYGAAERAFRDVLELDPDNENARGYLSYIDTIGRQAKAEGKPVTLDTSSRFSDAQIRAEGFYQNALADERRGDPYAAIRNDLRALRADADHAAASRHLKELRARLAGQVEILIEAGRTAFRNEDLQSALDLWKQALLIDPGNARTRAYIGRAERQLENLERLRSEPDVAGGRS